MHPLNRFNSLAKYKFQTIKCLLAGLQREGEPDHVVTFASPVPIETYQGTGTNKEFMPMLVIADLVKEIEELQAYIDQQEVYRLERAIREALRIP